MTDVLIGKIEEYKDTQREGRPCESEAELERCDHEPKSTEDFQEPSETRRGKDGVYPRAIRGSTALLTHRFWTLSLQKCESQFLLFSAKFVVLCCSTHGKLTQTPFSFGCVVSFTEDLRGEMRQRGMHILALCPCYFTGSLFHAQPVSASFLP